MRVAGLRLASHRDVKPAVAILTLLLGFSIAFAGGNGAVARKETAKTYHLYHPTPSQRGTVLLFHGFSNTTAMWRAEAEALFKDGYDVLVAALPGHGFVDKNGKEDVSRVPRAHEAAKYQKFASAMFDQAKQRSNAVHVVGFSVGGAHALEVALTRHAEETAGGRKVLRSLVVVNPYLSPPPAKLGPFHLDIDRVAALADRLTFGLASRLLGKRPYVFHNAVRRAAAGSLDVGLTHVSYGHIFGIGRLGDAVEARAKAWQRGNGGQLLPATVVITRRDPTASPKASARVAAQIGAEVELVDSDRHNLVTEESNPDSATRMQVRRALQRTLAAGLAADR